MRWGRGVGCRYSFGSEKPDADATVDIEGFIDRIMMVPRGWRGIPIVRRGKLVMVVPVPVPVPVSVPDSGVNSSSVLVKAEFSYRQTC